eukprot:GILJ01005297.1.p1 GENE.GILJ01005297.1~~GILJ01005297.1.p1  ORF type:complete len:1788 (-),score=231.52 GILJ01005297.1:332-5695(-)
MGFAFCSRSDASVIIPKQKEKTVSIDTTMPPALIKMVTTKDFISRMPSRLESFASSKPQSVSLSSIKTNSPTPEISSPCGESNMGLFSSHVLQTLSRQQGDEHSVIDVIKHFAGEASHQELVQHCISVGLHMMDMIQHMNLSDPSAVPLQQMVIQMIPSWKRCTEKLQSQTSEDKFTIQFLSPILDQLQRILKTLNSLAKKKNNSKAAQEIADLQVIRDQLQRSIVRMKFSPSWKIYRSTVNGQSILSDEASREFWTTNHFSFLVPLRLLLQRLSTHLIYMSASTITVSQAVTGPVEINGFVFDPEQCGYVTVLEYERFLRSQTPLRRSSVELQSTLSLSLDLHPFLSRSSSISERMGGGSQFEAEMKLIAEQLRPTHSKFTLASIMNRSVVSKQNRLIMDVEKWMNTNSRVMWISGEPGSGKSTAVASVVAYLQQHIGGYYFFDPLIRSNTDPRNMIASLCLQIANQLADFRDSIIDWLKTQAPSRVHFAGINDTFTRLIIEPFKDVQRLRPLILVIDGLDHCKQSDREVLNFLNFFSGEIDKLPPFVKFIFSSSPDLDLQNQFLSYQPLHLRLDSYPELQSTFLEHIRSSYLKAQVDNNVIDCLSKRINTESSSLFWLSLASIHLNNQISSIPVSNKGSSIYPLSGGQQNGPSPNKRNGRLSLSKDTTVEETFAQISVPDNISPVANSRRGSSSLQRESTSDSTPESIRRISISNSKTALTGDVSSSSYYSSLVTALPSDIDSLLNWIVCELMDLDLDAQKLALKILGIIFAAAEPVPVSVVVQLIHDPTIDENMVSSAIAYLSPLLLVDILRRVRPIHPRIRTWFTTKQTAKQFYINPYSSAYELTRQVIRSVYSEIKNLHQNPARAMYGEKSSESLSGSSSPVNLSMIRSGNSPKHRKQTLDSSRRFSFASTGGSDQNLLSNSINGSSQSVIDALNNTDQKSIQLSAPRLDLVKYATRHLIWHLRDLWMQQKPDMDILEPILELTGDLGMEWLFIQYCKKENHHIISDYVFILDYMFDQFATESNTHLHSSFDLLSKALNDTVRFLFEYGDTIHYDPILIFQTARNYTSGTSLHQSAIKSPLMREKKLPIATLLNRNRPQNRIIVSLTGHQRDVICTALSHCQRKVVSGSTDCTLRLYDSHSAECINVFEGHEDVVNCCAISLDDKYIVSGSDDSTIRVWDLQSAISLHCFEGHTDCVMCCAILPDNSAVVSGSWDGTIKIWNMMTGDCEMTLEGHNSGVSCLTLSSDGSFLVSGSEDQTIRRWDMLSGVCISIYEEHDGGVTSCALCETKAWIVSASSDDTVRVWSIASEKSLMTLVGQSDGITCCHISSNGDFIVTGNREMQLKLWDVVKQECITVLEGHQAQISSCVFSDDASFLLSSSWDGTVKIWDLMDLLQQQQQSISTTLESDLNELELMHTPRGTEIKSIQESLSTGAVVEKTGDQQRTTSTKHRVEIDRCTADEHMFASSSIDKVIKVWDANTCTEIATLVGHMQRVLCLALRANKDMLISGDARHHLKIWGITDMICRFTLRGHADYVNVCDISKDGEWIVSGSCEGRLILWHTKIGKAYAELESHNASVNLCRIAPSQDFIVSCDEDGVVKVWDRHASGATLRFSVEQSSCNMNALLISLDSTWFLVCDMEGVIKRCNSKTGERQSIMHADFKSAALCCSLSEDETQVLSGYEDGTMALWDVVTGEELHCFFTGSSAVTACAVLNSYCMAITRQGVFCWTTSGKRVLTYPCDDSDFTVGRIISNGIASAPTVVVGCKDGTVLSLRLDFPPAQ